MTAPTAPRGGHPPSYARVELAMMTSGREANLLGDPTSEPLHVASAHFVFVAIDGAGQPRPVPPLVAETPEERRRMRGAGIRRAHRLAKKQQIETSRGR